MPPLPVLASFADALAELVLPATCIGCGQAGTALCDGCAGADRFAVELGDGLRVHAAGRYRDELRTALIAYKERGRRDLARSLATRLTAAVEAAIASGAPPSVLVPVPSTPAARRVRGGDHVLRMARRVGRSLGLRVAAPLCFTRKVADSAGLSTEQRAANLTGALRAAPAAGVRAVIVDDIVTTGATLREAARALRAAGWDVAGSAVVAATERRLPESARRAPPGTRAPTRLA